MATIVKLKSGSYRVQVRRKGQYASKTFLRKSDADDWVIWAIAASGDAPMSGRNAKRCFRRYGATAATLPIT